MKGFGIHPKLITKELNENKNNLKISSTPNEYGEYAIDFNGSEEELLKQLNCIKLEDALKKFNDLRNKE